MRSPYRSHARKHPQTPACTQARPRAAHTHPQGELVTWHNGTDNVTVDPTNNEIDAIMAGLGPDLIQLHGKEPPARVREIAQRTGSGIIKVIAVGEASDVDAARVYEPLVEHLMFETRPPKDADRPGGLGVTFDWTLLKGRRFERPWFLAGGLNPWNVADAVAASGAPILDVSSGVERGPGLKDPALIQAFLDAARRVT